MAPTEYSRDWEKRSLSIHTQEKCLEIDTDAVLFSFVFKFSFVLGDTSGRGRYYEANATWSTQVENINFPSVY